MDLTEFLGEFQLEAGEKLDIMASQLLRLERDVTNPMPVRELFLAAHTIKGGAAMLRLTDVQVLPTTFHLHQGSPPGYLHGMLEEFAEILDSARESLPASLKARADEARAQILGLERDAAASFTYTCFRARAR